MIGIKRDDGGLSVMHLVDGADADDEIAKWEASTGMKAIEYREITSVPPREFRGAYELGVSGPQINMPKAREIRRDQIRAERAPLLAALDIQYQRADERGDIAAKADIARRKQVMRDAPADPAIEAAKTIQELKEVRLEEIVQNAAATTIKE